MAFSDNLGEEQSWETEPGDHVGLWPPVAADVELRDCCWRRGQKGWQPAGTRTYGGNWTMLSN